MGNGFIRFRDVSFAIEGRTLLEKLNVSLEQGLIYALIGPNGGGKSVFMKLLGGIFEPTSGALEVTIDGKTYQVDDAIKRHILRSGFVFEHGGLMNNMSVFDNIALPLRYYRTMSEKDIDLGVRRILGLLEMESHGDSRPSQLSHGNRRLVNIAMALANNPQLILYDSPTLGLDPGAARAIKTLIRRFHKQYNVTSMIATNDIDLAADIADRLVFIDKSTVLMIDTPAAVMRSDDPGIKDYLKSYTLSSSQE
ncbi:MAG TPA: ATP-binding cassette domain-containing protein [bacterium]|nr:ATP-binding cassette domain-containing protein [bacterium]